MATIEKGASLIRYARPPFSPYFEALDEAHRYELQSIFSVVSLLIPYLSQCPKSYMKLESPL